MNKAKVKELAAQLRKYAQFHSETKRQKVANLVVAATGLELLRRKLED
tara:strand:- start:467 stop:610 length:144 start_codon:yes stop_codon:yes gene_type:complete